RVFITQEKLTLETIFNTKKQNSHYNNTYGQFNLYYSGGRSDSRKYDDFKEIIGRMVSHVRETEPTTLTYSYFENGTGTEFRIIEQYASVEAVLAHNENIAAFMVELQGMISFRKITGFGDVDLSNLPEASREILDNIYHEIWTPFARK
ncbi:MAG: hypothetical protein HC912_01210, partial [Saprospiraceae bacterium]|nr:hypothetical protein [Saprospiraceae bacterium]